MAYDEALDERVDRIAAEWGATRRKMFGGTGYMLGGNMMAGVHGDRLVLRLHPDVGAAALRDAHVSPFDMALRPMPGWVMVDRSALGEDELRRWLEKALAFVRTLPPK